MSAHFEMKPCDNKIVRKCMAELGLPHFLVSTCVARGFDTAEKIEKYLSVSLDKDWRNPLSIPGMEEVAETLKSAILEHKRVVVFGDFDLDGISATTVMTRGLRALGANVMPFIPDRFKHGYGLSMAAFEEISKKEPDLIVTVDCGIANREEVRAIKEAGVEVVITDHHEAGDLVPEDVLICDPKYKGNSEDATLAGVGVALKVIDALGSRFGFPHLWRSYTDFAALGTVADMMPFHQQNRALVKDGIEKIRENCRPCIRALLAQSNDEPAQVTSTSISFTCVPRLNSAGRLGKSEVALKLLLTDNYEESERIATELDTLNTQRRNIEADLAKEAIALADKNWHGQRCVVVSGRGWHEGVKGIVSARLVDRFEVPAFMFAIVGDEARGSGRGIGDIDLFEVVNEHSDLFIRYGGHKNAVGVTLPVDKLEVFEQRMNESLSKFDQSRFKKHIRIDTVVSLDEMTVENLELAEQAGPFGQENEEPLYLAKNVTEFDGRLVGATKEHFLCKLSNGHNKVSCIEFRCKNAGELLQSNAVINAIFTAQTETWRGEKNVKTRAQALLPLAQCPALNSLCSDSTAEFIDDLFNDTSGISKERKEQGLGTSDDPSTARKKYEQLAYANPEALEKEIIKALIGDNSPHDAQKQLLQNLKQEKSCLGVMATGRGKSLVFQAHATLIALKDKKASIFIYPLRALMADQACHLSEKLSVFGIKTCVLNGETPEEERKKTYEKLKRREVDILLTTPEYLQFHGKTIAEAGDFGFLVIDEAHHVGEAKVARAAYGELGSVKQMLKKPTTVALTATATKEAQSAIKSVLDLDEVVFDDSVRSNLHINDQRNIAHKDDYLAHLIAEGKKTVVYVGTREQTVAVARRQRIRVPQLAPYICFYNAGLSREERKRIEDLFRNDEIQVLIATSAFGEGIDIPNIRNVVLYHMPTDDVQFNQMSGRAGRDGGDSWIHLLYGKRDASVNEAILLTLSPKRDLMAVIYKRIMLALEKSPKNTVNINSSNFAKSIGTVLVRGVQHTATPSCVESALKVFCELGLLEDELDFDGKVQSHIISKSDNSSKVELTDSVRYCEGMNAMQDFEEFKGWALQASISDLTNRITHPIF